MTCTLAASNTSCEPFIALATLQMLQCLFLSALISSLEIGELSSRFSAAPRPDHFSATVSDKPEVVRCCPQGVALV